VPDGAEPAVGKAESVPRGAGFRGPRRDSRLEDPEPPEPLPPSPLDDLKDELEALLHVLNEYVSSQQSLGPGQETIRGLDILEPHARESVERLREEIREMEGSEI
jgi:hypothetical protein